MLSVIVPVYNCEKYIERCINSLINQSIDNFEIIVIDDGSNDNSYALKKKIAANDSRIKIFQKKNEGLLAARLDGVRSSSGDTIGFVDGDDYIGPDMFYELNKIMEDSSIDLVSSGIIREYDNGTKTDSIDRFPPGIYDDLGRDIYPTMLWNFTTEYHGLYCNLVNKLFRRDKLLDILENIPKNITYGEDAAVFYSYMMKCKKIFITDRLYYHYCIRNNSMCASKDENLSINDYLLYQWLAKAFEGSEQKNVLFQQLKQYILMIERHRITMLYDIHPSLLNCWEFDLSDKVLDEPFIIYGAGGCGQAFYAFVRKKGKQKNIVAWIDKNYKHELNRCNYPLVSIEEGLNENYEKVIVAIKNNEMQENVKEELLNDYNIMPDKIVLLKSNEFGF